MTEVLARRDADYVSWEAANSRYLLSLFNKYSNPSAAEYWAGIYDPLFVCGSQRGIEAAKLEHRVGTYELSLAKILDDFTADNTARAGSVTAGATAAGEIGHPGDHDWFAVTFESGKTYRIDLKGAWSRDGTLADPYLRGVHDSAGEFLDWSGYFSHPGRGRPTDDDGGNGTNARLYFTPYWNGVHYIAVSGDGDSLGTYTLEVEEFAYGW